MAENSDFTITAELNRQLQLACPGVTYEIGDAADKTTWVLAFPPAATSQQQIAAQTVIANFDPNAALAAFATKLAHATAFVSDSNYSDMAARLATATPTQIVNFVNNNSTADAGTKTILAKILIILGSLLA